MFEEKESFWKKKGFYISACTLLIGILAVGVIYYRQGDNGSDDKLLADIATEVPEPETTDSLSEEQNTKEIAQTNAGVSENITTEKENSTVSEKKDSPTASAKTKTSQKTTEKKTETKKAQSSAKASEEKAKSVSASVNTVKHTFDEEKGLLWPVKGDVILKYSMSNTIYFKTLAQYKCNPAIAISAKKGTNVKAAADCRVTKIEKDDELGTVVTTDIGDNYTVSYGQLDNISVNKGDELKEGDVIGTVASPTKYYTEEGSNLYFQVKEGKKTVDPLLLLR